MNRDPGARRANDLPERQFVQEGAEIHLPAPKTNTRRTLTRAKVFLGTPRPLRLANRGFAAVDLGSLLRKGSFRNILRPHRRSEGRSTATEDRRRNGESN
jgi:hypothetical protein